MFLVGYADDVDNVISARTLELAQSCPNQEMYLVNHWARSHGRELVVTKTKIVMLTRSRMFTVITMIVGNVEVQSNDCCKILGHNAQFPTLILGAYFDKALKAFGLSHPVDGKCRCPQIKQKTS